MEQGLPNRVVGTWRWLTRDQRAVRGLLAMVVGIDILLIAIHIVVMWGWDAPDLWRIDMDSSFGEAFQYVKYLWVALLIVWFSREHRNFALLAWVPLLVFFLVDDALLLHEQVAYTYSQQDWAVELGPLSAQAVGELAFVALVGLVLLAGLAVGYVRADTSTRWVFRVFGAVTLVMLFFAVVVDAGHSLVQNVRVLDRGIGIIEDGGEMLVLSLLVAVAFRLNVQGGTVGEPAPARDRRHARVRPRMASDSA